MCLSSKIGKYSFMCLKAIIGFCDDIADPSKISQISSNEEKISNQKKNVISFLQMD